MPRRRTESGLYGRKAAHDLKHGCAGSPARYDCAMLQALRAEDALAIAEVARRRSRDEQAMAQYLGIGRGRARKGGAPGRYALAPPRCCRPRGLRERGGSAPRDRNRATFARCPTPAHSAYLAGTAAVIEF